MSTKSAELIEHATAEHAVPRPPFAAPYVWVLAVIDGEQPDRVYRVIQYETVIGRGAEAQIELDDEEVSKRHCLLRVEGAVCSIQDQGSLNGTRINGRKMRDGVSHRLRHLDQIQIGTTRLMVLTGSFKEHAKKTVREDGTS